MISKGVREQDTDMSILKVAKRAGVSKSTVSRVINSDPSVKASTRETVLATIAEMGYHPNVFAQGMRTNQSRTIAVLIPEYANPFFSSWLTEIEKVLKPHNYSTMAFTSGEDEDSELASIRRLMSRRSDGLIFHSYNLHEGTLQLLRDINAQIPIVSMDSFTKNSEISSVYVDGFNGTREAVHHLIDLGRRRIAYVNARQQVTLDRLDGYRQALKEAGLTYPDGFVFTGDFSMDSGLWAGEHFLGLDPMPDAIVCATDNMALGLMKYLLRRGIRVPEQISVIGFDNLAIDAIYEPSLSSIAIPIDEMGRKAAELLLHQFANPGAEAVHIALHCELILRDSTPKGAVRVPGYSPHRNPESGPVLADERPKASIASGLRG